MVNELSEQRWMTRTTSQYVNFPAVKIDDARIAITRSAHTVERTSLALHRVPYEDTTYGPTIPVRCRTHKLQAFLPTMVPGDEVSVGAGKSAG